MVVKKFTINSSITEFSKTVPSTASTLSVAVGEEDKPNPREIRPMILGFLYQFKLKLIHKN